MQVCIPSVVIWVSHKSKSCPALYRFALIGAKPFEYLSPPFFTHADFLLQILTEGIAILRLRTCWLTSFFSELAANIPILLSTLAGQDLSELEEKAKAAADALKKEVEELNGDTSVINADMKTEPEGEEKITEDQATEAKQEDNQTGEPEEKSEEADYKKEEDSDKKEKPAIPGDGGQNKNKVYGEDEGHSDDDDEDEEGVDSSEKGDKEDSKPSPSGGGGDKEGKDGGGDRDEQDDDLVRQICLGLRVYTKTDAPAVVGGQLRREMGLSFDGLAIQA